MKSLQALMKQNKAALHEIRVMWKEIGRQRGMLGSAASHANEDPEVTTLLKTCRLTALRQVEECALEKLCDLEALAQNTYEACSAGVFGVVLGSRERDEVIRLAELYPNQAIDEPLPEILFRLRAALFYDDRPAQFFFSQVVRARLRRGEDKLGARSRDQGWEVIVPPSQLHALLGNVDDRLRYVSELPALETAAEIFDEVAQLRNDIWTVRAARGESGVEAL